MEFIKHGEPVHTREPGTMEAPKERMLKWFEYKHLPKELQAISKEFFILACEVSNTLAQGPEKTVALRKLLEAKDAAVRATVHPGG